ncbi:threonylcarbamoyl-AMP synthase [Egibacter rhizosphaerae]|uniref:Threonylcarbamoyl-AMP synthase n=1 Tax=Egibacter rhizosphaerae TaxID=1670831 RepID=A0A411YJH1_9ACTN|nr:L-threonylcarbamoyladenylate synthase [Egibacter rhizosphaerae]QBI21390.1 threonylcarbamoyl-AMP synthase [Egibacter rhizosphaerae]
MTTLPEATVVRVDHVRPDPAALAEPAARLRDGGLVAFPTETVYGLGANALDPAAVAGIFRAKGRPADNPLIVHLADPTDLPTIVREVPPLAADLVARWWPGPLTLVLDAHPSVPAITTGQLPTVGVRVPAHPVARALIASAGVPVAAPSANRSGRPSPTSAPHVVRDLGPTIDAIVDGGPCAVGLESTVVDARGSEPRVLREGAVTREDLDAAAPDPTTEESAASPGTRYRHYAPACEVAVVDDVPTAAAVRMAGGQRVGAVAREGERLPPGTVRAGEYADLATLAHRLYGALRAAEEAAVDVVLLPRVPEEGLGRAVADRIARAAEG